MTVTMQSQSPYSLPQQLQQYQPQFQQVPGQQFQQFQPQQQMPLPVLPISFGTQQQFHAPHGGQQYQVYPGYQAIVVQVPQQLVPELLGQQHGQHGQGVAPVLPIAYTPGMGIGAPTQQWAGGQQQTPYGQQFGQAQWGQPYGRQQFAPQQFAQRPTVW